tara:strand:+ start:250 stop:741 length:492 start_codon:yes stop_codon:yes gene_type:complete
MGINNSITNNQKERQMSLTKSVVLSLVILGVFTVILYHQLTPTEEITYEPVIEVEEYVETFEPEPISQEPEYEVVYPDDNEYITFEEAFASARASLGDVGTFEWNNDTYHTRTVEEELLRILNLKDSTKTDSLIHTPNSNMVHTIENTVSVDTSTSIVTEIAE